MVTLPSQNLQKRKSILKLNVANRKKEQQLRNAKLVRSKPHYGPEPRESSEIRRIRSGPQCKDKEAD